MPHSKSLPEHFYDRCFYQRVNEQALKSAHVIVPYLLELLPISSVVDIGCGCGAWLAVFQKFGVSKILGLDGPWVSKHALLIPESCSITIDLQKPFTLHDRFDLAICLEVAEHLPKKSSKGFIGSITELAPAVLFSAALPGQEGTLHVNEQWPGFWARLFKEHGFFRLDPIRRRVWMNPEVAWYYQQNMFLYVHEELLRQHQALRYEKELSENCPLTLIHPKILRPLTSARHALRLIPRLVFETLMRRLFGKS